MKKKNKKEKTENPTDNTDHHDSIKEEPDQRHRIKRTRKTTVKVKKNQEINADRTRKMG